MRRINTLEAQIKRAAREFETRHGSDPLAG